MFLLTSPVLCDIIKYELKTYCDFLGMFKNHEDERRKYNII